MPRRPHRRFFGFIICGLRRAIKGSLKGWRQPAAESLFKRPARMRFMSDYRPSRLKASPALPLQQCRLYIRLLLNGRKEEPATRAALYSRQSFFFTKNPAGLPAKNKSRPSMLKNGLLVLPSSTAASHPNACEAAAQPRKAFSAAVFFVASFWLRS